MTVNDKNKIMENLDKFVENNYYYMMGDYSDYKIKEELPQQKSVKELVRE